MRYSWIALLFMFGCPKFQVPVIPNSAKCTPAADFKSMDCTIGTAEPSVVSNITTTADSDPMQVDGVTDENDGTTDEVVALPPQKIAVPTLADFLKCMQIEDVKYFGAVYVGDSHTRSIEIKNTCAYTGYLHVDGVMRQETTDDGEYKLIDEGANTDYHVVVSDVWVEPGKSAFVEVEFRPTYGNVAYGIGKKVDRFSVLVFNDFTVWIDGVETLLATHNEITHMNLLGWVNEPVAPVAVIKAYVLTDEVNGYYDQIENGASIAIGSSIKFNGKMSFGAGVGDLTYSWAMSGPEMPPEGSETHIDSLPLPIQAVTFDQPGDYSLSLVVGEYLETYLDPHWSKIPAVFTVHIVEPGNQ